MEASRNSSNSFEPLSFSLSLHMEHTRLFSSFLFSFNFFFSDICIEHSRERNSFNRGSNAIFARTPRPTVGRSCEEMHRADYLEPRKWNTVISVSRERNPISLLRRGFVRIPRNKGRSLLSSSLLPLSVSLSLSISRRSKIEEREGKQREQARMITCRNLS